MPPSDTECPDFILYILHPIASRVAQVEMRKLPYVNCVAEKGFRPAELAAEIRRQSSKKAASRVSARRVEELIASAQNASHLLVDVGIRCGVRQRDRLGAPNYRRKNILAAPCEPLVSL